MFHLILKKASPLVNSVCDAVYVSVRSPWFFLVDVHDVLSWVKRSIYFRIQNLRLSSTQAWKVLIR